MNSLARKIREGDLRSLAQAATAVENGDARAHEILRDLEPFTGHARVVGITGPPGAGKSTLVDALAAELRRQGKTVAIIAVDPSSRITGGAILGDRIRMQQHHADAGIFIRSMATRGTTGGIAHATADMARLMDAAGRDFVVIETVGVGQDEVEIAGLAQVTVVVLVPGMGDDIQAIKAGIMEIADIFVINKADQPGADRVERELHAEVHGPAVVRTVATEGKGIPELLEEIGRQGPGAGGRGPAPSARGSGIGGRGAGEHARMAHHELEADDQGSGAGGQGSAPSAQGAGEHARMVHHGPETEEVRSIDHLGIAVPDLERALAFYQSLGLAVTHRETVETEKVRVAMMPAGESRIELLEPTGPDSPIAKFLEKRGPGLHHVALRVRDLEASVARLRAAGARLLNEPRRGAGGHLYVFVHPASTGGVLLELIQESES